MAEALPPCTVADGAATTGAQWQRHPTWLYRGIVAGAATDASDGATYPVILHDLGVLDLPDGRLVACDPYLADAHQPPFRHTVPAGAARATVAVARIAADHTRVAAALLVFADAPVVRWSMAVVDDDEPPAEPGAFTGYGVDAGVGCFAAPAAFPALVEVMQADEGRLEDPVSLVLESGHGAGVAVLERGVPSVAAFRSGWGDGVYPTWFGHGAGGGVVLAITDFLLFADPWSGEQEETTRPDAAELARWDRPLWYRLLHGPMGKRPG